jgi:hypothetical protein
MVNKSRLVLGRNNLGWGSMAIWVVSIVIGGFILAGSIGVIVGLLTGVPVEGPGFSTAWLFGLIGTASGVIAGLVIGVGQWLALRGWVDWSGDWVKASVVGWAIAGGVGAFLGWALNNVNVERIGNIGIPVAIIAASIGLGVGQWLFLRNWLAASGWWILANTVACIFALFVVFLLLQLLVSRTQTIESGGVALIWLLVSVIFGVTTWVVLHALVSRT